MNKSNKPTQVVNKPTSKPSTQAQTGQHDRERERQVKGGVTTQVKKG